MEEFKPGECHEDEFECSECDFKSLSESDMHDHSEQHISSKPGMNFIMLSGHLQERYEIMRENKTYIQLKNESVDEKDLGKRPIIQDKYEGGKESEPCLRSKNIQENENTGNSTCNIKIELISKEDNINHEYSLENKNWNKKIKLEDIDIEEHDDNDTKKETYSFDSCKVKTENWQFNDDLKNLKDLQDKKIVTEGVSFDMSGIFQNYVSNHHSEIVKKSRKQNFHDLKTQTDYQNTISVTQDVSFASSSNNLGRLIHQKERIRKPRKQSFKNLKTCQESEEILNEDLFVVGPNYLEDIVKQNCLEDVVEQNCLEDVVVNCFEDVVKPNYLEDVVSEDYLEEFFVVKTALGVTCRSFNLLNLCKICNFSCKTKKDSYDHARIHFQEISGLYIVNSIITTNYDFFVCLICHRRIMKKYDVQIHMKYHKIEQISSSIVDVKLIKNADGKSELLHCCEICPKAFPKYLGIYLHIRDHTTEEIEAIDNIKYHEIVSIKINGNFNEDPYIDISENIFHCGGPYTLLNHANAEVVIDHKGKYIPDGWQRKAFQIKNKYNTGYYKIAYISPFGKLVYNKSNVTKHIKELYCMGIILSINIHEMNFENLSDSVLSKGHNRDKEMSRREEIEVDNTNIYVPEGWQRKLFRYKTGHLQGEYFIYYISPFDTDIISRTSMRSFLKSLEKEGCPFKIDIEKLDYEVPSHHLNKHTDLTKSTVEVEVDNTGKYIPDGWQRKVYKIKEGPGEGYLKVKFVTQAGKIMHCKAHVLNHLKMLETYGNMLTITVDKMDFTTSSHNLPIKKVNNNRGCLKKECGGCKKKRCTGRKRRTKKKPHIEEFKIKLDDTDIYVPEGWQRKVYKYIKGPREGCNKICYISPYNTKIHSPSGMREYLTSLEEKGIPVSVNMEKINFHLPSYLRKYDNVKKTKFHSPYHLRNNISY